MSRGREPVTWCAARRLLLRGPRERLARALEWLHVRAAVRAVREDDFELEVALDAPLGSSAASEAFDGLSVEALPENGDRPEWTGLERDRGIVIGARIVVRPPWVARPAGLAPDVVELVVPRGMAFGSGEHGSTQAALLALDSLWPPAPPPSFLDVGTGSGILALYAHVRGVPRILACDVEASAVAAAARLVPSADVRLGGPAVFGARGASAATGADADADAGAAASVVANLDASQLDSALPAILALWNGSAPLVLSGLRAASSERDAIVRRVGLPVATEVVRGDFTAVGFARR